MFLNPHYTDTGYGHVVQHHQRTSSQQFYNLLYTTNSPPTDKNLPHRNARAQHLMSRCWNGTYPTIIFGMAPPGGRMRKSTPVTLVHKPMMLLLDAAGWQNTVMNASSWVNKICMETNRWRHLLLVQLVTEERASGNKIYRTHLCYYATTENDKQPKIFFSANTF